MTATLSANASKDSASFLSYRKYCCCLCTRSGINDLIDFETSIFQEIREESEVSHLSLPKTFNDEYHNLRRRHSLQSTGSEYTRQMSYKLIVITGAVWFMQFYLYAMLYSFYPILSVNKYNNANIYVSVLTIICSPSLSLLCTPLLERLTFIYKIGLSKCIVIGLLFQGILCLIFAFVPEFIDRTQLWPGANTAFKFNLCNALLRTLSGIVSAMIEIPLLSVVTKITLAERLSGLQNMPLFCMFGLTVAPFLSGYLYCFGYKIVFLTIGALIIICAVMAGKYLPAHINAISKITGTTYMSAYTDMNVLYSSIVCIYSLICVTYLLSILSIYISQTDPAYFDIAHQIGVIRISTYYLVFGLSFIILSFAASTITYRNCGSLKTMLSGMFGVSIGLLFLSRTRFIFSETYRATVSGITTGLWIMGISSAFSISPYLLYLRNALFRKYKTRSRHIAFSVYRLSVFLGIIIGPVLGSVSYESNNSAKIESILLILCVISFVIAVFGFVLFKCLRYERIKSEPQSSKTPLIFSNSQLTKFHKQNIANGTNDGGYEIKYYPLLQDDKLFCCFCSQTMCFCSFGAFYDHKNEHYKQLRAELNLKKGQKRNLKIQNSADEAMQSRRASRKSFDETENTTNDEIGHLPKKKTRKKSSKKNASFGGGNVEHEYTPMYGNDGRTVSKDSDLLLEQSWNTLLHKNNGLVLNTETESTSHTNSSESKSNSREKSRRLKIADIHTPRGHTAKAIQKCLKKNNGIGFEDDIEMSLSSKEKDRLFLDRSRRSQSQTKQRKSVYAYPKHNSHNLTVLYVEDEGSDSDYKGRISRKGSANMGSNPTTPIRANRYQRVNSNNPNSLSAPRPRLLSRPESVQSSTEAQSQTFLLLSDEDFISGNDIYNEVPEESPLDAYFTTQ